MDLFDLILDIWLSGILNRFAALIIGIAVLLIVWGLARYILQTDTVEGRQGAKDLMIWGVVVLFVMVSMWGLVALLAEIVGVLPGEGPSEVPQLDT